MIWLEAISALLSIINKLIDIAHDRSLIAKGEKNAIDENNRISKSKIDKARDAVKRARGSRSIVDRLRNRYKISDDK